MLERSRLENLRTTKKKRLRHRQFKAKRFANGRMIGFVETYLQCSFLTSLLLTFCTSVHKVVVPKRFQMVLILFLRGVRITLFHARPPRAPMIYHLTTQFGFASLANV